MVPTLLGRIQTRFVLLATVGVLLTLILAPSNAGGLRALVLVAVIGIAWECAYHFAMQWRWEKDWPTLLGLLTGINEGLLIRVAFPQYFDLLTFACVWIAVWLVANGPMRVPFLRWRFRGGRLA